MKKEQQKIKDYMNCKNLKTGKKLLISSNNKKYKEHLKRLNIVTVK